jgi:hypothetical protein
MVIVERPTSVQTAPLVDVQALMTFPALVSFSQRGATPGAPVCDDAPLVVIRRWKASPLAGEASMNACLDPGANVARIITPAFVHGEMFSTEATRATISPSPESRR